jgi:serine/threonine protein kinase
MTNYIATLADGNTIEYLPEMIGEGGMKQVYFTKDKQSVICFYKDQSLGKDPNRLERLNAILGKYNPTISQPYFDHLFCWVKGIVIQPKLGVLTALYPPNFFFQTGFCQGKEKEGSWFVSSKLRNMLPDTEKGQWLNYFSACILLARGIRRLHQAGLAHSDLSNRNVLIDPTNGRCLIIDIDSLVVPQLFAPDVLGTRGYIAPEVLTTAQLPLNDPKRQHPSALSDQHALAVLIYQYLFGRHPLEGPKVNSTASAEEDDFLSMGQKALFIEHPVDHSNRSENIVLPYTTFGSCLSKLFERAFINGLHSPNERPAAIEWEKALAKTWDILFPCQNPQCSHHWFVFDHQSPVKCPFCGTRQKGTFPLLSLRSSRRQGQWMLDGYIVVYHNLYLYEWHVFDHLFPCENSDKTPQAYCVIYEGKWLLINQSLTSLTSPSGNKVAIAPAPNLPGQAIELKDGVQFRLSQEEHGRLVEVQMINCG